MKKIFSTLCMALVAVVMMGQEAVISFDRTEHDFGRVDEGGRITTEFTFKNEGMAPLVLSNVRASCGCTTPSWPKEPIEPGQVSSITVTYNTNGRPGRFQKTITVTSNAKESTVKLYIKGEVTPKQAPLENKFVIQMGDIRMKSVSVDLGKVKKGEMKNGELEFANLTKEEHRVELATNAADNFLITQTTLPTAKPNEIGKFIFALDTKATKLYGPIEANAYVVVDGKREINNTYKLTVRANIVEDFSQLTVEQKQNAPIIEVQSDYTVEGAIIAGKTRKFSIPVTNSGVNPLEFRRIYCKDDYISIKSGKAIRSGHKASVAIEINTKGMKPGAYDREIQIITNDYANSVKRVKIHFTVE